MIKKLRLMSKLKKGDNVAVLLGKDSGRTGKVVRVNTKTGKVMIEGVNLYKRHVRKMGDTPGGIIDITKLLDISNVALICPHCKKPTRVGYQMLNSIKSRICRKCRKEIVYGKTKD